MDAIRSLMFAIDYDDTYTADPEFFDKVIDLARERGHKFICLTQRRQTVENMKDINMPKVRVYFTGMASKLWWAENNIGERVDIWIDDDPKALVQGK